MASKKKAALHKVCRIFQWIESQDDRLAGVIRDLCMEGALTPGFGSAGVTFLYPKDKAYRDEIVNKAEGDDPDGAVKIIESLIIPDSLQNASDFQRRPVGSHSGVLYDVEEASGDTVKLKGGVTIKKADDFHLLQHKEAAGRMLAVWNVTAGKLPLAGASYQRPRRGKGGDGADGGSRRYIRGGANGQRAALAAQTEAEFDSCMRQDGCKTKDPFLAKSVSLLAFLKAKHPDILASVLPVIDYSPVVTFYLLLEPYKTSGAFMIPDGILFSAADGWNGADIYQDAVGEFKAFFDMAGQTDAAKVFSDHAGVVQASDLLRQQTIIPASNKMALVKAVRDAYDKLEKANSIGGLSPIFPASTLALLGGGKKYWQDEFRFIISEVTKVLYANARASTNMYNPADWQACLSTIRNQLPGNDYVKEPKLLDMVEMKSNVAPTADFYELRKFANSTDFLYVPSPGGMVGGYMGSADDPTDDAIYNRNYEARRSLERGRTRRQGISPQALTELRMYAMVHGGDLNSLVSK